MITRRMLKDNDGDLAKVSLEPSKQIDLGQKWRSLKNYSKFFKNPLGHIYWRTLYAHTQGRGGSPWNKLIMLNCAAIFFMLTSRSVQYKHARNTYLDRFGASKFRKNYNQYEDDRDMTVA